MEDDFDDQDALDYLAWEACTKHNCVTCGVVYTLYTVCPYCGSEVDD